MFIYTSKCNNKTWWNFSQPSNIIPPHRLDASSPIASSGPADQQKSSQLIHPNFGISEWSSSRSNQSGYWILKLHQTFLDCVSMKIPVEKKNGIRTWWLVVDQQAENHMAKQTSFQATWEGPCFQRKNTTSPLSPQTQLHAVPANHHFVHAELGGLERKPQVVASNQNRSRKCWTKHCYIAAKNLAWQVIETIDHAKNHA